MFRPHSDFCTEYEIAFGTSDKNRTRMVTKLSRGDTTYATVHIKMRRSARLGRYEVRLGHL